MKRFTLVFKDFRGNPILQADSDSFGMLKCYAFFHLKGKQSSYIVDNLTGEVLHEAVANGRKAPTVTRSVLPEEVV